MRIVDDEDQPVAWRAIRENTPVFATDNQEVGVVHEVLGSETADIFHGLVIRSAVPGHEVMVPGAQVGSITTHRIDIALDAEKVRNLPPYQPEDSYRLGFVGLFRKHLGWTSEKHRDHP
jgi:hypothetical protein